MGVAVSCDQASPINYKCNLYRQYKCC
ncbi:hypothetical protein PLANTIT3_110009 [Plantibacter sp. T3]|nr:hypothetical protein PLANTIT3_110009 [Plantibacter sp. T3]